MKLMDKIAILTALKFRIDYCITKMSEPDFGFLGQPECLKTRQITNKEFWGKELDKYQSAYKAAQNFKCE